ncbi:MAG: RNA polymerase sigma factor SigZ [Deltaproteobacteria bacterium]|nr:RNA polymerase sigma factor SigZ [Deltaproteobacteria bacterium]
MLTTQQVWTDYGARLEKFLRSKVSRPEDAEDLLQDILVKTHANLHRVKDTASVKAWLMQIARRSIVDYYRSSGRNTDELGDQATWWDDHDVHNEPGLAACVRPFLRALDDESAVLLEAVELDGRSQKEIADDLGVSYSTVKSRVQRARAELKKAFHRCCRIEVDGRGKVIDFDPWYDGPPKDC